MLGPIAERSRQGRGRNAGCQHQERKRCALPGGTNHSVTEQARNQRAQGHAQQFGTGHQRLELDVANWQPDQKWRGCQGLCQRQFKPLEHLTQAHGNRRRKQQCEWPERQQSQRSAGIKRKPARPNTSPAVYQADFFKPPRDTSANPGPGRVQHQIDIGRNARRQIALQRFHAQGQQSGADYRDAKGPLDATAAQGSQCQQKTQWGVASQVDADIKTGPVLGPWRRQKLQRRNALVTPIRKGVKAGIHNQANGRQRQRPRHAPVPGIDWF